MYDGKLAARYVLLGWPLAFLAASLAGAEDRDAVYGDRARAVLTVATGSPGELGLLEALATAFKRIVDSKRRQSR